MTLFEDIIRDVLKENVASGSINDAIDRTYEVKVNYLSDGGTEAEGDRIIQPVAYGLSKAGNPVIRAFQPYGDTKSKIPAWKLFRVDRIISWKPLRRRVFRDRPPGGMGAEGEFNDMGDRSMSTIYNIAVFGRKAGEEMPMTANGPLTKKDIIGANNGPIDLVNRKNLGAVKKKLDNPDYIKDIVKDSDEDGNLFMTDFERSLKSKRDQFRKHEMAPGYGDKIEPGSASGPKTEEDIYKTDSEKDIESKRAQFGKHEMVPDEVLDNWKKERERRNVNK